MLLSGVAAHKKKRKEKYRYQRWHAFCHLHHMDKIKDVYSKWIQEAEAAIKEGELEKVNHFALLQEVALKILEDEPDDVKVTVKKLVNPHLAESGEDDNNDDRETRQAGNAQKPDAIQCNTATAYMMWVLVCSWSKTHLMDYYQCSSCSAWHLERAPMWDKDQDWLCQHNHISSTKS